MVWKNCISLKYYSIYNQFCIWKIWMQTSIKEKLSRRRKKLRTPLARSGKSSIPRLPHHQNRPNKNPINFLDPPKATYYQKFIVRSTQHGGIRWSVRTQKSVLVASLNIGGCQWPTPNVDPSRQLAFCFILFCGVDVLRLWCLFASGGRRFFVYFSRLEIFSRSRRKRTRVDRRIDRGFLSSEVRFWMSVVN